jgi:hypothetical protein
MSSKAWSAIEEGIRSRRVAAQPISADGFWSEFRMRARRSSEAPAPAMRPAAFLRWAAATACTVAVAGWFLFHAVPGAQAREADTVRSLDIVAPHSAVLMVKDESTQSTIVWIAGMQLDEEGRQP